MAGLSPTCISAYKLQQARYKTWNWENPDELQESQEWLKADFMWGWDDPETTMATPPNTKARLTTLYNFHKLHNVLTHKDVKPLVHIRPKTHTLTPTTDLPSQKIQSQTVATTKVSFQEQSQSGTVSLIEGLAAAPPLDLFNTDYKYNAASRQTSRSIDWLIDCFKSS